VVREVGGKQYYWKFPISRDPPEGGTGSKPVIEPPKLVVRFQFLGIPPKGEPEPQDTDEDEELKFPISRDPPEGGTRT